MILVTGVNGQLGHDVVKELMRRNISCKGIDIEDLDITDKDAVYSYLHELVPSAVIHCAAYTAVDKAEDESDICWRVNVDGTANIALACRDINAKMLYISTDYVFPGDGENYYDVNDNVNPKCVYGISKLAGELAVESLLREYFIVRISWVFGINGNNFVKTMLRLSETRTDLNVVCDQIGSPTYTKDLAVLLSDMILTDKYGIYHATNEGVCSWAEFAQEIFRIAGKSTAVHQVSTEEYPVKANRPRNSRLSKQTLTNAGFSVLPHWKSALQHYLEELKDAGNCK